MSDVAAPQKTNKFVTELNPQGIKPVEEHGESARQCEELVKKHRECMASLGYKV
ncbi:related to COX17 - Cytochrome c oxidase copper chaperone [Melanopsichium pennsylvanicum]|uniref:Related to COX17 - Cytochrome c oxidase copper chaperone n=2 Tax=Melanopsichium pennsylvanicum TaxID=63383 RepID=A0AAJ4XRG5_9BASI|nr:related to COX17-Cytochrome c oxidase copper chaperone [Melanopsichium pennsylvanicum 4]SNX85733.1 related to COX17 - Cytochrome c oxidase copper chaperone [Melanopsichium pennsylvanicum]